MPTKQFNAQLLVNLEKQVSQEKNPGNVMKVHL